VVRFPFFSPSSVVAFFVFLCGVRAGIPGGNPLMVLHCHKNYIMAALFEGFHAPQSGRISFPHFAAKLASYRDGGLPEIHVLFPPPLVASSLLPPSAYSNRLNSWNLHPPSFFLQAVAPLVPFFHRAAALFFSRPLGIICFCQFSVFCSPPRLAAFKSYFYSVRMPFLIDDDLRQPYVSLQKPSFFLHFLMLLHQFGSGTLA